MKATAAKAQFIAAPAAKDFEPPVARRSAVLRRDPKPADGFGAAAGKSPASARIVIADLQKMSTAGAYGVISRALDGLKDSSGIKPLAVVGMAKAVSMVIDSADAAQWQKLPAAENQLVLQQDGRAGFARVTADARNGVGFLAELGDTRFWAELRPSQAKPGLLDIKYGQATRDPVSRAWVDLKVPFSSTASPLKGPLVV